MAKITEDKAIFFDLISPEKGVVSLTLEGGVPTNAFIKGEGKIRLPGFDSFTLEVSLEFLIKLYLTLKLADEGVEVFYEERDGKRITVFEDSKNKPNYIGIKVVDYENRSGGVIWVLKDFPRIRFIVELKKFLKEFPILAYKEADLTIIWNRQLERLGFTADDGEWVEVFSRRFLDLWREIVWWNDKTGNLPIFVQFHPENEELLSLHGDGRFIVLGREYNLKLFKKVGYLIDI
jgi:hypothetical protein